MRLRAQHILVQLELRRHRHHTAALCVLPDRILSNNSLEPLRIFHRVCDPRLRVQHILCARHLISEVAREGLLETLALGRPKAISLRSPLNATCHEVLLHA